MTASIRLLLCALVCAFLAAGAFAQSSNVVYHYTQFDVPSATSTEGNGINNGNVIAGSFTDSGGMQHGYILQSGKFTTIDFPSAVFTNVRGINDNGDVAGVYSLAGSQNAHGFVRHSDRSFTKIDDPKATLGTVAAGISKSGEIVGTYDDRVGFIFVNGTFSDFNAPTNGNPDTLLNGLNNLGEFVGQVFSGDDWRGFWVTGGTSDLDFFAPLFATDNMIEGVNGHGDLVGCHDGVNGFLVFNPEAIEGAESSEKFPASEPISFPGTNGDGCPMSINFARAIVGTFGPFGATHGFMAAPMLTLKVSSPTNGSTNTNPVHVIASASGVHPVAQMQIWVNGHEVFHVSGGSIDTNVTLPVGTNERFVVQAVDSTGTVAKVVETITVK